MNRYVIMQKLGWGEFSTVWLAKDFQTDKYVALQIQKSAPRYQQAAFEEIQILQKVARSHQDPRWTETLKQYYPEKTSFSKDDSHVVQLLNSFIFQGPFGNHFCMVFEILGVNLLEVIQRHNFKGLPINLCRNIAQQVLIGLDYLHRICGVIHTDIKPENILLCLSEQEINTIVENGMKSQSQQFNQRVQIYQRAQGIIKDPPANHQEKTNSSMNGNIQNQINLNVGETHKQSQSLPNSHMTTPNQSELKIVDKQNGQANQFQDDDDDLEDEEDLQQDENQIIDNPNGAENNKGDAILTQKQKKLLKQQRLKKKKQEIQRQQKVRMSQNMNILNHHNITDSEEEEQPQEDERKNQLNKQQNPTNQLFFPSTCSSFQLRSEENNSVDAENEQCEKEPPKYNENIKVQIADLGNACWVHQHFSSEIQTRQYRSPEAIIGINYGTSTDIWSFACLIFQMLTGEFLFQPRQGPSFGQDDDHLAQIMELLNKFPKQFSLSGIHSKRFFDNNGFLKRIPSLHYWPLKSVLIEKYRLQEDEAKLFASFLQPLLISYPHQRASAQKALSHPWIHKQMEESGSYRFNDLQFQLYSKNKQQPNGDNVNLSSNEADDSDILDGDIQDNNQETKKVNIKQKSGANRMQFNKNHLNNRGEQIINDEDYYQEQEEENQDSDYQFYGPPSLPLHIYEIDRSFTDIGYVGYGDRINLDELDNTANWQFQQFNNLKNSNINAHNDHGNNIFQ